jgi:hypothetical protein
MLLHGKVEFSVGWSTSVATTQNKPETSRIAIAICIAFVVVGSWAAYFTDSRIDDEGARAQGVVLKKDIVRSADGNSDYSVVYEFGLPSGETLRSDRNLPKSAWMKLKPGGTIEVRYSESEPRRNFPAGGGVTSIVAAILATFVFGGLAVLGGGILIGLYRSRNKTDTEPN